MENISISDFDALGDRYLELDRIIEEKERDLKPFQDEHTAVKNKIAQILQEQNKKNYTFRGFTASLVEKYSVTTPKTPEEKRTFLGWLAAKYGEEVRWDYVSVNSQKLNSFYKAEREQALERKDIDFTVPGVGKEQAFYTLSVRRK